MQQRRLHRHETCPLHCNSDMSALESIEISGGNDEGKSVIGYYIIIVRDLMVQLCLLSDFKHQVLQYDGVTLLMK